MDTIESLVDDAVNLVLTNATDYVFSIIQNDRELMSRYLHLVASNGDLRAVNKRIADEVKLQLGLSTELDENGNPIENEHPHSLLIQSYTLFSR